LHGLAGSGGRVKFRRGLGQEIRIENESPTPIVMSFMAERTTYPAPGLAGGRAGGRGDVGLNGKRVDNRKQYLLKPGDEIVLRTPGGGGYGPPRARDRKLAARDRALGYVRESRGKR